MVDQRICYVIMPFTSTDDVHTTDYWTKHYEGFLKPTIESNPNFTAKRSTPLRGDILREIIKDIVISPIVVADLTGANPNVYWELGVRQSFRHGTITIAEDGTHLPFDVGVKGTLFYKRTDLPAMRDFVEKFGTALRDCDQHPEKPDSHVLETVSGRGSFYEIFRREEIIRRLDSFILELESDLRVVDSIEKIAQHNLANPTARRYPMGRFKLPALELLYSSRYLDIEPVFYGKINLLYARLSDINELLNAWHTNPERVEKFVREKFQNIRGLRITTRKFIEQLASEVRSTQEKLSRQA